MIPKQNPSTALLILLIGGLPAGSCGPASQASSGAPTPPHGDEAPDSAAGDDSSFASLAPAEGHEQRVDLGEVVAGDVPRQVFRLKAAGDRSLIVERVKPSCGCTVAEVRTIDAEGNPSVYRLGDPIPSGTEFEVEASIDTEGRQGEVSSTVTLFANTESGFFNLHLSTTVVPVLTVDGGSAIDLGQVSSTDRVTRTTRVRSELLDPFVLAVDPSSLTGQVFAEVRPVDPDEEGRSTVWEVSMTFGPGVPEGTPSFPIRLVTDRPVLPDGSAEAPRPERTHDLRIFLKARVTGAVSATPSLLSFGTVYPDQVVERASRISASGSQVRLSADVPFRVEGPRGGPFELEDYLDVSLVPAGEGDLDLVLHMRGLPEEKSGPFVGLVRLDIGDPPKEELVVRFSGVSRVQR